VGRYSPTVLPERGEDLGAALADAIQTFRGVRQDRKQERIAQEDRERRVRREDVGDERQREQDSRQRVLDAITRYQSGYREGEPPPDAPPEEQLAALIAAQRGNRTQAQDAAPPPDQRGNLTQSIVPGPRPPHGGALPGSSVPGPVDPRAALAAPSAIRQAGTQFYRIAGGYIDPTATPDARQDARAEARDTRTFERQGARDEAIAGREGARDERLAGREDVRDDRRYRREMALADRRGASAERVARIRAAGGGDGVTGEPLNPKTLDARGRIVGQQLGAAERVLDDEGAELEMDDTGYGPPPDSSAYHAIAAEIDSLRGVQGEISAARGGDPRARTGITRGIQWSGYKQGLQRINQKRERALGMGLDPAKVNAAYARDVAALAAQAGLAGGQQPR